ncbi:hypothetical protein BaRGS_00021916 [Batillaria attramentaria]|uniref:Uncharacterized protein n=1 Tax=Batillaria attramentaria TaxID=370345 RepID=A0ABD0KHW6_9CAEN
MADKVDASVEESQTELGLEQVSKEINAIANSEATDDSPVNTEEPEKKPTLTDHLNKKLLSAFLDRLNSADNTVAFGLQSSSQNTEQTDPEKQDFSS